MEIGNASQCLSDKEIVEKLRGKPNGTRVSITFAEDDEDAFAAVGFLAMMNESIIKMDGTTFIDLYAVGSSSRWDGVSRTCEVTLDFKEESDLTDWFAHRLRYGVVKLEVV